MNDLLHLVNSWSESQFVQTFGTLFEDSAWIAERAAPLRPFDSFEEMMQTMLGRVLVSEHEEQLELLRKHPDLGARISMSSSSVREQAGAGLDLLTPEQYTELQQLNSTYTSQYGFPFILAVKGHTTESILDSMRQRQGRAAHQEFETALMEVSKIAGTRLQQWLAEHGQEPESVQFSLVNLSYINATEKDAKAGDV
ncbi:2-oxo-4-hydroxy-4-carboxy-5-ureidoimidazoline decarboxylase [Paenibacillus barcinonensis]|uniref:2-oxo-4-hydroxy-4-carboxy-5-ureidoimidazoline decarboxylase n=1 Tax=Paenibacillus barcinonensis TaxID=198119 RepID=A0A2V4WCG2_PAEBA|nr:2-oxo-4-hydroxy-4-carboxy-5-ureidoimidazoline decarboxylase [Paenibacillus barcinonensis]PYE49143.1 2-oxo-4-hydroxy-4-carboxy-5-ureidoimidazoline decarboxylase [Paenibacillus barcinonensis]QKS55381.1 2-oxo-4-hydroxy-4-carboxy-5-ureidoimidazoline decarboxylase [Paenibacillus barcinonensis]